MKNVGHFTSCMHVHVRYYIYNPKVVLRIKGIVQIHHGFAEHADRYDHIASYLANQGFVVVVSDFVGHGKSLIDFEQGYFGEKNGPQNLVKDMFRLVNIIRRRYPDEPYFLMGVDLGSVVIRKFVSEYGDYIDGMMLLGTPTQVEYDFMKRCYLKIMRTFKGPLYKADRYFHSWHKRLNKKVSEQETAKWLTSDESQRRRYLNDPMTHFAYTIQGYRDIVHSIREVNSEESIMKIPHHLSIYIGTGEEDPMNKGLEKLVQKYKKAGIKDVTYEVFEKRRHALLFEVKYQEIYQSLLNWLNERTYL